MPIGDNGSADPPFERKDLDMSNPVERELSSALQRARGERIASRTHPLAAKPMGLSPEFKPSKKITQNR